MQPRLVMWVAAAISIAACRESPSKKAANAGYERASSSSSASRAPQGPPSYMGSKACSPCHQAQAAAWHGSHHDLAMQSPDGLELPGFDGQSITVGHEHFEFRRSDVGYVVDVRSKLAGTEEPLQTQSYPVRYVFGTAPLRQVLLDVGDGRLQALSVAWDTRPDAEGGQRWFFLHPEQAVPPGDALHWKGPQFNWNHQCSDCHSTGVQKNYQRASDSFETSYREIDVACESCHGPGSGHVAAVKAGQPSGKASGFRSLKRAASRRWVLPAGARVAHLIQEGKPGSSMAHAPELEVCAACHSRRSDLGPATDTTMPDRSYHDRYRLALLEESLYFADGQIKDEVFVYGSFLQSRMHQVGVTCSDCHQPHSLDLVAHGNALCGNCHRAEVFDTPQHHFHALGSEAAACVSCHMPERTYMVLDGRRDHRFGVPAPKLAAAVGAPDACTGCHDKRSQSWAEAEIRKRHPLRQRADFATALHAARAQLPDARRALATVVSDDQQPALVRASALAELARLPGPQLFEGVATAISDSSPLLRRSAASALTALPLAQRQQVLPQLLRDPIRSVRLEAASAALHLDQSALDAATRRALRGALDEYVAARSWSSDRAESLVALASVRRAARDLPAAEALLLEALQRDPTYSAAYVNLADSYRASKREADAAAVLARGLSRASDPAPLHHALGLSLIRNRRMPDALRELSRAHELSPSVTHYAYVYAVGLHDSGKPDLARNVLRTALKRAPGNEALLTALIDYCAKAGLDEEAARHTQTLKVVRQGP